MSNKVKCHICGIPIETIVPIKVYNEHHLVASICRVKCLRDFLKINEPKNNYNVILFPNNN